jgi:hypothetical protein
MSARRRDLSGPPAHSAPETLQISRRECRFHSSSPLIAVTPYCPVLAPYTTIRPLPVRAVRSRQHAQRVGNSEGTAGQARSGGGSKGGFGIMKRAAAITLALAFAGPAHAADDEHHSHPAPEKLGSVHFPTSCTPAVQREFDRGVALPGPRTTARRRSAYITRPRKLPTSRCTWWRTEVPDHRQSGKGLVVLFSAASILGLLSRPA